MLLSLPNSEQENFINAIFKNIVIIFKNGSNKIANKLIIELIHTLKSQNSEITKIREDIYKDNSFALQYDTDDFYDSMEKVQESIQKLLKESEVIKNNSEMLAELHDIVDELYTNMLQLNYQVSSTVAIIEHEKSKEEKFAS